MRRLSLVAVIALLALAALSTTAFAKEGAVTKFDGLPTNWQAGQTYLIGYTILMDGVEPYKADTTEILIRNANGKALAFPGIADGKPGHYVARVNFPIAGTWTMQVTQGSFFVPMDVGTLTVAPATAANAAAPAGAPSTESLPAAVGIFAALIALGGAVRLAQLSRANRRVSATA